jgi:RNA polymerase subunit RPABC4/transcription elongation factor Spt4
MTLEVASAIRLGEAYFCLNCEVVTNCSDICPACGHKQLWHLENWIGKINVLEYGSDKEGPLKGGQLAPTFLTV